MLAFQYKEKGKRAAELMIANKELVIIVMLTSSDNVVDIERVRAWDFISDYSIKPLTEEILVGIIKKYFEQSYNKICIQS